MLVCILPEELTNFHVKIDQTGWSFCSEGSQAVTWIVSPIIQHLQNIYDEHLICFIVVFYVYLDNKSLVVNKETQKIYGA